MGINLPGRKMDINVDKSTASPSSLGLNVTVMVESFESSAQRTEASHGVSFKSMVAPMAASIVRLDFKRDQYHRM